MKRYIDILFPFIATLILWRLDSALWNPCGILAIIPIFYYSFVRPRAEFLPMAILGCVLLDYSFDTLLFWTIMFSAAYGANGLQSYIDVTRQKKGGIYIFMFFLGLCLFLMCIWAMFVTISLRPVLQTIWLFLWVTVLYIPFAALAKTIDSK